MNVANYMYMYVPSEVNDVPVSIYMYIYLLRAKQAFWCVQWHGFSIYIIICIFQAVRRAVNVLNFST